MSTTNSKVTRVQPVFRWFEKHGGIQWGDQLVRLASGLGRGLACGAVRGVQLAPEAEVAPTPQRLAWMIRNADRLVPQNGQRWRQLGRRLQNRAAVERALSGLDRGEVRGVPKPLILEGKTHADCLIECEGAFIWIEGKRLDWLSPCTTWDVSRDQLARNVEAVWTKAQAAGKDYCLIICHEHPLKHHETLLLQGYRRGTWSGGWPHLDEQQRREFATRIGTLTWATIATEWPDLGRLPELADLETTHCQK